MTKKQLKDIIEQIANTTMRIHHKLFHHMVDELLSDPEERAALHGWISNW